MLIVGVTLGAKEPRTLNWYGTVTWTARAGGGIDELGIADQGVTTAKLADAGVSADAIGLSKERDDESPTPRVRRSGGLKAERVFRPGQRDPVMLAPSSRGLLKGGP